MGMRLGIGKALQMFTVFSTKLHFDNNHFSLFRVHLGKVHTNINRQKMSHEMIIKLQDCMVFCDGCDQGYHMACHRPILQVKPPGKWECSQCCNSTQEQRSNSFTPNHFPTPPPNSKVKEEENALFLPILPPHIHPRTSMLPENWEDYDVDPRIPDVSEWQPVQLRDFFTKKGFSDALSAVFLEQVSSLHIFTLMQ